MAFTGNIGLVNSFHRLGLKPVTLCAADPQRLGDERHSWGSYYESKPWVHVGNIRAGFIHLRNIGMFDRLGLPSSLQRSAMSPERERFKQVLRDHAEHRPNAIALWGDHLKLDYATLYAQVMQRQQRLRDEGAKVVALALDNGVEAMLWDLAVLFEGLTCVLLPPFFSPAQRAHCLEQSQAGWVIAEPELDAELETAGYEQAATFWRRTFSGPGRMFEGTAKLTFTSGTTGTPKGVCLSAESILRVARELDQASKPADPQHHLALLPLAILLENLGCYAALYAGVTLSLPSQKTLGIQGASGVDVPRLLGCLASRAPQSLILVPQLLQVLVGAAEHKAFNPGTLRFAAVGGARVSQRCCSGRNASACRSMKVMACPNAHRWFALTGQRRTAPAVSASRCPMCRSAWAKTAKC